MSAAAPSSSVHVLDRILAETRSEVERRKVVVPVEALAQRARSRPPTRGFAAALRRPGSIACISEFKRKSPSAGWIRKAADPAVIGPDYERHGAAALSVLTDEPFFGGTLADLERAREAVSVPILRKDFTVDAYQVVEARAHGADAILLIVAALDDRTIGALLDEAARWQLDVLVEAHDPNEVDRAVRIGAKVVGVNHRNLKTFEVDTTLAERMRDRIPADRIIVAESGLRTAADVARMKAARIDAILVGESLMRASSPGAALTEMLGGS